jgi:hypothetical protein
MYKNFSKKTWLFVLVLTGVSQFGQNVKTQNIVNGHVKNASGIFGLRDRNE